MICLAGKSSVDLMPIANLDRAPDPLQDPSEARDGSIDDLFGWARQLGMKLPAAAVRHRTIEGARQGGSRSDAAVRPPARCAHTSVVESCQTATDPTGSPAAGR
jgi:hypothetical protein